MKTSRFKFEYRKSASKLHRKVGDILRKSVIFGNYEIYQEYPVSKINPMYQDNSHHFDWVIPAIKLVIECHGKQHYVISDFSGLSEDHGIADFKALKKRDEMKAQAAILFGYTYIVVPYTDEKVITEDYIWSLYKQNENIEPLLELSPSIHKPMYNKEKHQKYLKSDKHQAQLEKAREYRKEQYRRQKEIKNGNR